MEKDIEILEKALELACYNQVANTFNLTLEDFDIQRLTRLYMDFYKDKAKDFQ